MSMLHVEVLASVKQRANLNICYGKDSPIERPLVSIYRDLTLGHIHVELVSDLVNR